MHCRDSDDGAGGRAGLGAGGGGRGRGVGLEMRTRETLASVAVVCSCSGGGPVWSADERKASVSVRPVSRGVRRRVGLAAHAPLILESPNAHSPTTTHRRAALGCRHSTVTYSERGLGGSSCDPGGAPRPSLEPLVLTPT